MSEGVAFVCDGRGLVRRVLRDDLQLLPRGESSGSFAGVLEAGSIAKWFRLLEEVEEKGSAHGWELQTRDETSLTLAAAAQGREVVVVAAPTVEALSPVLGDLAAISTEYAELLRRMQQPRPRHRSEEARWARFTEVTNEMAAMQRELARKNRELERLDAEKNQLLGMVAHDLRTPIQTILVAVEALAARDAGEIPQRLVSALRSAATYMQNLVNDALDYAAIESGRVDLDPERVELVGLVRQVVELHELSAQQRSVSVELAAETPEVPVTIDPGKIEQVVANLLSNAIKFSPDGGTVRVAVRRGDLVEVEVSDEGAGVPADLLPRLFKPFVGKGAPGLSSGPKSTGLGLAIAQRIATAHGGEITVASPPGEGATFTLRLPAERG